MRELFIRTVFLNPIGIVLVHRENDMRDEEMSRSSGFEEVSERTQSTRMKRSGGSTVDLVFKISSIVNNCSDRNKLSERIRDSLPEIRSYRCEDLL